MQKYVPHPEDTSDVVVSDDIMELAERMAENTHEVWAQGRINDGWVYGEKTDREKKSPLAARSLQPAYGKRKGIRPPHLA